MYVKQLGFQKIVFLLHKATSEKLQIISNIDSAVNWPHEQKKTRRVLSVMFVPCQMYIKTSAVWCLSHKTKSVLKIYFSCCKKMIPEDASLKRYMSSQFCANATHVVYFMCTPFFERKISWTHKENSFLPEMGTHPTALKNKVKFGPCLQIFPGTVTRHLLHICRKNCGEELFPVGLLKNKKATTIWQ